MPYPKRLLNDGEEIALDLRPHWIFFGKHVLAGLVLLVTLFLVFDLPSLFSKVWGVLAIVWALWVGLQFMRWNATHFVVTSDRVIYRTGVLSKHGVEIPLERINNINFHQRIFERMIGAGDLEIESAGREGQSRFEDVWHPDGVQQEIYRQMDADAKQRAGWIGQAAAQASQANAQAVAPAPNAADQLQQLADLRDRGVITPEEFEAKKADLLDRM